MSLKSTIESLNRRASTIRQMTRDLNIAGTGLIGVAAVIPDDAPLPAAYYKGCKVILHNVCYDPDAGSICASITMPYKKGSPAERYLKGARYKYEITEKWFE